jgi:cytochrome P450
VDDLLDPTLFERGVAHTVFARLAEEAPLRWHEWARGGFWAVLRHGVAARVLSDDEAFSSARGTGYASRFDAAPEPPPFRSLNASDGEAHAELRAMLRRAVGQWPNVRARAEQHCARLGEVEFMSELAEPFTTAVLADVLGLDEAGRRELLSLSYATARHEDPEVRGERDGEIAWQEAERSLMVLIERWLAAPPAEGALARLAELPLEPRDRAFLVRLLVQTGHHSTALALGGAALALAEEPSRQEALEAAATSTAVEELLRWTTPVVRFGRLAVRDLQLEGHTVRAGERVVVFFPAANRDPAVFSRAQHLDLARAPNPHLAFGEGPHGCFGAHVARLQIAAILDALRGRRFSLAAPPTWLRSSFNAGPRRLVLRLH